MRRREFIRFLGSAAVGWPVAVRAQAAMPVVGFLNGATAENYAKFVSEFRRGLNEMGFIEGQNVVVEYRWAEGHYERLPDLAADLINQRVAVIAATRCAFNSGEPGRRNPITGIGCCARAASGIAAAPPSAAMNSRRLMFPPRLREDQRIESDEGLEGPKMNFPHATRMSALGQKQTFAPQKAMSALPPIATAKADFRRRSCPL